MGAWEGGSRGRGSLYASAVSCSVMVDSLCIADSLLYNRN